MYLYVSLCLLVSVLFQSSSMELICFVSFFYCFLAVLSINRPMYICVTTRLRRIYIAAAVLHGTFCEKHQGLFESRIRIMAGTLPSVLDRFRSFELGAHTRPPSTSALRTSDLCLVSHTHGRERREERGINKRELQEAVKYGRRERANPGRSGDARWRYIHKGIVYITDETSRHEITSWRLKVAACMECTSWLSSTAVARCVRPTCPAMHRGPKLSTRA